MKLVELRVKNFRAIGSGKHEQGLSIQIDENNIIFLIGKNNAGKSSILSAYDYFVNNIKAQRDDFHKKEDIDENAPIEIEVRLKGEPGELQQLKLFPEFPDFPNDNEIKVKKEWNLQNCDPSIFIWLQGNWKKIYDKKDDKRKDKCTQTIEDILEKELPTPVWIRGMSTSTDTLKEVQKLITEAIIKNLKSSAEYIEAESSLKKLQQLINQHPYSEQFQEAINRTLQKIFPKISLTVNNESEEIDLIKIIEGFTRIQANDGERENIALEWQGHGVQRNFIFSVYKECHKQLRAAKSNAKNKNLELKSELHTKKTTILLVEEPELFLHPTAIRSIRDLLYELARESEFQVLCATHSPIMIDLQQKKSSLVRVVNDNDIGCVAYQVSEKLLDIRMLEEFDPHVCEAFFTDKVILVEGNTEAIVIRRLIKKILEEDQSYHAINEFHIVTCNGKTTIPEFQKILCHFKIDYIVFHDSDYRQSKNGKKLNVWTTNEQIWNHIQEARSHGIQARRFVSIPDFEKENGYHPLPQGKPITAYTQVQQWLTRWHEKEIQEKSVIKHLKEILYDHYCEEEHTQKWLISHAKDEAPEDFQDEETSLEQLSLFEF